MTGPCATVRIESEISTDNPTGYIVVNESDYDDKTMTLFEPTPETEAELAAREADAAAALEAERVAAASAAALLAASAPPAVPPVVSNGWGTAPPPPA